MDSALGFGLQSILLIALLGLVWSGRKRATSDLDSAQLLRDELATARREAREDFAAFRAELNQNLVQSNRNLREELQGSFKGLSETVEKRLELLQRDNSEKLEQMRKTVDEKLESTLQKRLGDSFKLVSERLEQVHKGLGEMQTLATGVGDLKKVLTNVKTRGTWGEIQLGSLLEQMLTPDQFVRNYSPKRAGEVVEFAVRFPGAGDEPVHLPLDSKFPIEDYQRLIAAQERGDVEGAHAAADLLEAAVRKAARDIRDKYIHPPATTDYAILFLPTESLYAEVLRRPGLIEALSRDFRVVLAGPSTLAATLSSFQMGFRTLAIQKRSSEVWNTLSLVKTQFGQFGELLTKVQKKLQEAGSAIEQVSSKSRNIETKLRKVESLPGVDQPLLGPGDLFTAANDSPDA